MFDFIHITCGNGTFATLIWCGITRIPILPPVHLPKLRLNLPEQIQSNPTTNVTGPYPVMKQKYSALVSAASQTIETCHVYILQITHSINSSQVIILPI